MHIDDIEETGIRGEGHLNKVTFGWIAVHTLLNENEVMEISLSEPFKNEDKMIENNLDSHV